MRHTRSFVLALVAAGLLAVPALADAQSRGRAAPRGTVRAGRPPVVVTRPYYYGPYRYYRPYRPGISLGFYYGAPWYGSYAYGYPWYGYPYGASYYGSYPPYAARRAYGGIRIDVPQRDAEVYVDGYYTGTVDDFDGTFQQLNLEPGPHHIELRADGYEPVGFDVTVEPGRTITYRAALREARP